VRGELETHLRTNFNSKEKQMYSKTILHVFAAVLLSAAMAAAAIPGLCNTGLVCDSR
jgi:hypothetical protein